MEDYAAILETLGKLEVNLVDYAELIKKNADDGQLVHHIFRFAHNLKSALAMAHRESSSHLIHAAENNFDLIRKGNAKPSRKLIQNCLVALDLIRTNLYSEEENVLDLESQTKILEKISSEIVKADNTLDQIVIKLSEEELKLFEKSIESGFKFYRIEKLMSSEIEQDIFNDLPIYYDVKEAGILLTSYPSYDEIPRKSDEFVLTIIFSSNIPSKDLELKIFDPFKEIGISKVEKIEIVPDSHKLKIEDEKSQRALVVDDDPTTLSYLQKILSKWSNCEVITNGYEAIELFKKHIEDNNPFNLVCLDLKMPKMNGFEVLKAVRDLESKFNIPLRSRSKILMISSSKDIKNKMTSFREQCDGYLTKPLAYEKILNELKKLRLIE